MRIAVLHVDDAFHAAPRDDGSRKKSLVGVFGKVAEEFEADVVVSLPRDGEQPLFARNPTRQAFRERQLDTSYRLWVRAVRCESERASRTSSVRF